MITARIKFQNENLDKLKSTIYPHIREVWVTCLNLAIIQRLHLLCYETKRWLAGQGCRDTRCPSKRPRIGEIVIVGASSTNLERKLNRQRNDSHGVKVKLEPCSLGMTQLDRTNKLDWTYHRFYSRLESRDDIVQILRSYNCCSPETVKQIRCPRER